MVEQGYNWRMSEIQALMGICQLNNLDLFISKRNKIAKIYDGILGDVNDIHLLYPPPNACHNRYKYILLLDICSPQIVEDQLRIKYDIPLGGYVYEEPCHKQPAFAQFGGLDCLNAEKLCSSHICLPIYQEMTDNEAEYVARSVKDVIQSVQL